MEHSWRPDGWKNPHVKNDALSRLVADTFEAGADAMVKVLKKQGFIVLKGDKIRMPREKATAKTDGILAFIPEETP